jgi:hypothetical protein
LELKPEWRNRYIYDIRTKGMILKSKRKEREKKTCNEKARNDVFVFHKRVEY